MKDNPWIPLFEITGTHPEPEQSPEPNAKHFLNKATKAFESAKNEMTYGETVRDLIANENGLKECQRSLTTIGIWHFECSVELFEKAIRNFERAKERGLTEVEQKDVEVQIKECRKQLVKATKQKDAVEELLNSITDKKMVMAG